MRSTTHPRGMQLPTADRTAGGEDRRSARIRHKIEAVLWTIGFIVFVLSCVMIHDHPRPFPIDLALTQSEQARQLPMWLHDALLVPSIINNPIPSTIALAVWLALMLVMAFISWRRGKSPLLWLQSAVFLVVTVMSSAGLNGLVAMLVNRPRPNPHIYPIHVYTPIVPFPTYPSGHTEHDVAYYGFLLYLSFTKSVREWRYRWLLLPLQLYAIYDIIVIGYSRIIEGDHWFTDVLGGYLEGAIYLFVFIFLYRWATRMLAQWQAKRNERAVEEKQ